jgi:hypothetical protein
VLRICNEGFFRLFASGLLHRFSAIVEFSHFIPFGDILSHNNLDMPAAAVQREKSL